MAEPISFKPNAAKDFSVSVAPGATREQTLAWNAEQLIGKKGTLTIGTTQLTHADIAIVGSGQKISGEQQAKLDAIGGRAKLFGVLDDLLAGAQKGNLAFDGKTERHLVIPPAALAATSGEFKIAQQKDSKPAAPVLPPAVGFGKLMTPFFDIAPARSEPLPGVAKGERPPLGVLTGPDTAAGWKHDVINGPAEVGGGFQEQAVQALAAGVYGAAFAGLSFGGNIKLPPEIVTPDLRILNATHPLPDAKVTTATYESTVAKIAPEQVFASAVKDLAATFGTAGVSIIPTPRFDFADPSNRTEFKIRFFVVSGLPPVAAPVEMTIDVKARTLHAQTLDGHPLRGTNHWSFESDGKGGTVIKQASHFQMSHKLGQLVEQNLMPSAQGDTWRLFHRSIAALAGLDQQKMAAARH